MKNKHNFQNTEEIISDEDTNRFSTINLEYFKLAKEFRNFVLKYNVSHEYISESSLNDIIKRPTEYIFYTEDKVIMTLILMKERVKMKKYQKKIQLIIL